MRRRALIMLLAAVAALAACTTDPYPLPAGPPHAGQLNPAGVGEPTTAIVLYITPRPGDRIELIDAAPVGVVEGATVRFLLTRPVLKPNGDRLFGEALEPLEGARFSGPSGSSGPESMVGIVAELTAMRPGRYELTSVRLRYRLNGREQLGQGTDVLFTVCAGDPRPTECSERSPATSP